MTAYQLDVACKAISKADRGQLKAIRSVLAGLQETGKVTVSEFNGLRDDIRNRADWLRKRG